MSTQPEIADDPCKDVKYNEPTVDSMRAQKDEVHPIHIEFFTDRNWSSVAHTVHTLSLIVWHFLMNIHRGHTCMFSHFL